MNQKIIVSFLVLSLVMVLPQVNAQTEPIKEVNQKSIEVRIDIDGNVIVKHEISSSNDIRELELVKGTVSNLKIMDEFSQEKPVVVTEETNNIMILPNQGDLTVQYNLNDVLKFENNLWTMNFRYLHTTNFFFPNELVTIIVNGTPVNLNDKKGLACHGCQMILEYTINEPKEIKKIDTTSEEFLVEIISFAELENFHFNQKNGEIKFNVNEENQIITTIIPLKLLSEPFTILLNDENISFHKYNNNGTHTWINLQTVDSGEIIIKGTTSIEPIDPQRTEVSTDPSIIIIVSIIVGIGTIVGFFILRKFSRR